MVLSQRAAALATNCFSRFHSKRCITTALSSSTSSTLCSNKLNNSSTSQHSISISYDKQQNNKNVNHYRFFGNATTPLYNDAEVQTSEEIKEPPTFQHPKAEEMYQKLIQLEYSEIQLISALIAEKLDLTITEADLRRGAGGGGGGGASSSAEASEEEAPAAEKTAFDLKLTGFDAKSKIKVIKEIRAITSLGLKEAKEMVEGAPKVVKKDIKMEEAEELKAKLEGIGATVEIV